MKKNKSIFKCWKLVWHIKIGFFIQKNCKISVARGVFGTAKKVKFTYQQQVHL